MSPSAKSPVLLLATTAGYVLWSVAFVVLYSALSVGCEFGWQARDLVAGITLQRAQLVVLFLVHLAAGLALVLALRRVEPEGETREFLLTASRWLSIAALGSTIFTFAGVFALSPCL